MKRLGKRKDLSIKEYFRNEKDFSKWLSTEEGVEYLSEQMGVTLKNPILENTGNGRFPVDITFEFEVPDEEDSIFVCVENQFGVTDHNHFSKLITYSANCGARYAVWIAESVHPDHKKAVQFLNENLNDKLGIFIFTASMISIDNSSPILVLEEVVEPEVGIIKPKEKNRLSELKVIQSKFWFSYKEKCVQLKKEEIAKRKPYPQHWYDIGIGSSKCFINISMNTSEKTVRVGIWIGDDIPFFNNLLLKKNEIENDFDCKLDWENKEEKKARHIWQVVIKDFDIFVESRWDDYCSVLVNEVMKCKRIFSKYV